MRPIFFTLFLFALSQGSFCQDKIIQLKDSIELYRSTSLEVAGDSNKLMVNDRLVELWKEILEMEASQAFDFSDLTRFSIVKDRGVTVVTWNLQLDDFTNTFYGVVGFDEDRKRKAKVLVDGGVSRRSDLQDIHTNLNWIGALYYEIVPFKRKNGWSYLLLGWRGENRLESYKIAEILSLSNRGLNLGLPILVDKGDRKNRLIIHYPTSLNYSMRYDEKEEQFYFNRLDIADESKGYAFNNVTPTYTFDAYQYKNGKWVKKEGVEV
ncbi:MAG: hypothetical protein ACPF8V_11075, partial [Luteibaculum sp.]